MPGRVPVCVQGKVQALAVSLEFPESGYGIDEMDAVPSGPASQCLAQWIVLTLVRAGFGRIAADRIVPNRAWEGNVENQERGIVLPGEFVQLPDMVQRPLRGLVEFAAIQRTIL